MQLWLRLKKYLQLFHPQSTLTMSDPELTREAVTNAFKNADKDGAGKLTKDQLKAAMLELETDEQAKEQLDMKMTGKMMDMVFKMSDEDGDGLISLDELLKLAGVGADTKQEDPYEFAMKMLKAADKNGDGFLDRDEVKEFMDSTPIGNVNVDVFMKMADTNGDGKLSLVEAAEFLTRMQKK